MYHFRCHARSLTFVLRQVTHRRRVLVLSIETIEKLDKRLRAILPHSTQRVKPSVATPRSSLPFGLCTIRLPRPHGPLSDLSHRFRTIVELDLDQPFRQTGSDDTQTQFHTLFGRTSNCQAIEDDWWLQTCHPTCLSAEENGSV